jgi:hypothetical protein
MDTQPWAERLSTGASRIHPFAWIRLHLADDATPMT